MKLDQNGVGVVSKAVRDALDIDEGDLIEINLDGYTTTRKLRDRGQVTIPATLRHEVGIEQGDLVQIRVGLPEQ